MAKNTYGLDLGSYEIKVYDKKKDRIWFWFMVIQVLLLLLHWLLFI